MNKSTIIVPKGIRYMSDWEKLEGGYSLSNYNFPHILNKEITGCGFTEYCIRNNQNLILLSPRKMLLQNKEDQHQGEILYARNEMSFEVNYEKDLSVESHARSRGFIMFNIKSKEDLEAEARREEQLKESILRYKAKIRNYIDNCQYENKPCKILVTYDSFRHVKDVLVEDGIIDKFQVVVDEFQSMLIDARFKSDTEIELLYLLQDLRKVCLVSATPMLDKYLGMLDEFKGLPYYTLDWASEEPSRVIKPSLDVRYTVRGLNEEISKVIKPYLEGRFDRRIRYDGLGRPFEIVSKEAVIYVNAVKSICRAIINNKLVPDQCNILCAQTDENNKVVKAAFNSVLSELGLPKIKRGSENWVLGSIPRRGEPHKMFTFCTRTVYLGADFYSTCAKSFIFSDSNIECLAVDVSMDLEQILGRQRLVENPWKNYAYLVIKTTNEKLTKEDFDERIREKMKITENLLAGYNEARVELKHDIATKYEREQKNSNYKYDYAGFIYHGGKDKYPVFNNVVKVAEQRAYDIQQVDYKDRFTVLNALEELGYEIQDDKVGECVNTFKSITVFSDKIKYLGMIRPTLSIEDFDRFLTHIPPKFGEYLKLLGFDKLKALKYRESEIENECTRIINNARLEEEMRNIMLSNFKIGQQYPRTMIKEFLRKEYERIGYKQAPKATDLEICFVIRPVMIYYKVPDGRKKENGFEIVSRK